MSGAALCAALTELGFDGEDPLDADALEWPFQYEEARPLLAWICSCLRPSNVLSPSHLSQYEQLVEEGRLLEGEDLDSAFDSISAFSSKKDNQEAVFGSEETILDIREAKLAYRAEVFELQKQLARQQAQFDLLAGQASSLIQGRRARVSSMSTVSGQLISLDEILSSRNLEMNSVLGRIAATTQELAHYHSGDEDSIYLAYSDFHPYVVGDLACTKELNRWFSKQFEKGPFRLVAEEGKSKPAHSQSYYQLLLRLHRWGTACVPKSGAALARDLEAARRARTPTPPPLQPRSSAPMAGVSPRQDAAVVSVAERRPLREREDAAVDQPTPAESQAEAVAVTEVAAGDRSTGSGEHATTLTTVGRGGSIWVRVLPKTVITPSLQLDSPQTSSAESTAAADDKYVWAEKYRPSVLKEFICNKDVAHELQLVTAHQCNHFIFEGPPAVGKRSMVLALIRDVFGPDDLKIEEHTKRFELKGEIATHIDVRVKISGHHVEVNLADLHGYKKHVITTLLNESIPSPNTACDHTNCRVIVVHDADKLSSDLQHYIGWFLGRYAGCNKIIFCCSDASNLEAVKRLCKVVTLQPPSFNEIIKVLEYIATQENIDLPRDIARRITVSASNNLRQAIRSFEATWKANYQFIEDQAILTGWEEEISNVAKKIMEEPSPRQLFVTRGKIRKLIEHNVSPCFVFCLLVTELKRDKDEEFQNSIDELASELNRCKECTFQKEQCKECKSRGTTLDMREINIEAFAKEVHDQGETIQCFIKIEEFTVRFMSFYRSLIAKNSSRGGVP